MKNKAIFISVCACILLITAIQHVSCSHNELNLKWQPVTNETVTTDVTLKVYMENSGSMDGYMCDSSQLKDAVKSYVSSLDTYVDSINLNYVNSKIIPTNYNIKQYISTLNPLTFAKAGGNRANSDISEMFEMILNDMKEKEVAMFVSDCIMDVPEGSSLDFFTDRQIDIRNAFSKHLRNDQNTGVEILRLNSKYRGTYFYYKGSEKLEAERPYYIFLIGDKRVLAKLNKEVPYTDIKHGVSNYFAYSTASEVPFEVTNKFGTSSTKQGVCSSKSNNGTCVFNIKMDLSSTLYDDNILCNQGNYKTIGSGLTIESVKPISDKKSPYSHVVNISINDGTKPYGEMLELIALQTPSWLETVNDETGKNIKENIGKTTGIKYIIGGIADAYKDVETAATIKFSVGK